MYSDEVSSKHVFFSSSEEASSWPFVSDSDSDSTIGICALVPKVSNKNRRRVAALNGFEWHYCSSNTWFARVVKASRPRLGFHTVRRAPTHRAPQVHRRGRLQLQLQLSLTWRSVGLLIKARALATAYVFTGLLEAFTVIYRWIQ